MQGALVKRARGVETRALRDAEGARERVYPRRSQDSDAHVLVDKTLTVKKCEHSAEPIVSLCARSPSTRRSLRSCVCTGRVSHRFGVSNPAKWAAQRAQLPVARGRTGLGAGPLMNLLNASDQGAHGPHSLQEIVNALKYAAAPVISVRINQ